MKSWNVKKQRTTIQYGYNIGLKQRQTAACRRKELVFIFQTRRFNSYPITLKSQDIHWDGFFRFVLKKKNYTRQETVNK